MAEELDIIRDLFDELIEILSSHDAGGRTSDSNVAMPARRS